MTEADFNTIENLVRLKELMEEICSLISKLHPKEEEARRLIEEYQRMIGVLTKMKFEVKIE